ncbi:ABC transporter permease [Candidatus Bathyarchaeota archaeon]|nr:ABC transporter permease [Candidatus Bathyarchaeota archaeon]
MMVTAISLAVKNLKTIFRDKIYLFFLLGMPIMMMLLIGLAFSEGTTTYSVGYVNNDDGPFPQQFITILDNASILRMVNFSDVDSLENSFRQGSIVAGLIIDEGYSPATANETVTFFVDESSISASIAIKSTVTAISSYLSSSPPPREYWKPPDDPISVEFNTLNFMIVGTLTYSVSIIIFSTTASIAKERDKGLFSRLRTTPMSTIDFLAGSLMSQIVISLLQTVSVFAVSYLIGFRPMGATGMDMTVNMLAAFVVAMILAVACVGVGLVIAAFAKNEDQAVGVSWFVIIPMMFLSGTWWEPQGATMKMVSWVFPTTYANKAIRAILARGAPLLSMSNYLVGLAIYAVIAFMVGVVFFRKKTM